MLLTVEENTFIRAYSLTTGSTNQNPNYWSSYIELRFSIWKGSGFNQVDILFFPFIYFSLYLSFFFWCREKGQETTRFPINIGQRNRMYLTNLFQTRTIFSLNYRDKRTRNNNFNSSARNNGWLASSIFDK